MPNARKGLFPISILLQNQHFFCFSQSTSGAKDYWGHPIHP
jgi:hypothetical protein